MELVKKATKYMLDNAHKVDTTFRCTYHMEPTIGWMNDPNGLIFVDGEFHLFYQSNVYDSRPNNMAWGHFISKDLVKYIETDIALYPDGYENGETGCFTGSSFIEDGELKIVYTKHLEEDRDRLNVETQFICTTIDKKVFTKELTPCVDENELPEELVRNDFRDPQIFFYNNRCYLIIGGRTNDHNGVFIVYSGPNSSSLHFDFYFGPYTSTRCMVECPSFVKVDGKDVIFFSSYANGENHGVYYIVGEFKPEEKTFIVEGEGDLDFGDAFYAPKIIENYEIPTLIGWHENWNKSHKTNELGHNWAGSFTYPRVLSVVGNELYQNYHPNILNYCKEEREVLDGNIARASLNKFTFKNNFILVLEGFDGKLSLYLKDGHIYLDTTFSNNLHEMIFKSKFQYDEGEISFLLDTSSLEIFINNGKETVSTRFFILGDSIKVKYENISSFITREIEVK